METIKKLFRLRKLPYRLFLLLLTGGASLILGFLSFSGMFAIFPLLSLAIASFILSVTYEGEIYLQNIKGAFKKLFKSDYFEQVLAKKYLKKHLLEYFPDNEEEDCPEFFKDYKKQLKLLATFGHKELDKKSKQRKKQIEHALKEMEKWFASQLFLSKTKAKEKASKEESAYALELQDWLRRHDQEKWQERLGKRWYKFGIIKGFSILSGIFMGIGTTYLIAEAFAVIPIFASIPFTFWPLIIVPLAVIAGAAYGMLTLNAMTEMVNNNTLRKWYNKLRKELKEEITLRKILMATMALLLGAMAVLLTICTAGTWWTIAKNAQPIFEWMKKIPTFVMGIINPIITGLSALVFIVQNTAESLDLVDEGLDWAEDTIQKGSFWQQISDPIVNGFRHLRETENWLQILNPFRLILKLTIAPLRILLFLGHLASVAVTADRMPGIPQIVAALVAMISEGFEDAHYFIGHEEEHDDDSEKPYDFKAALKERLGSGEGHDHHGDIPTWILRTLTLPVYILATLWDMATSHLNKNGTAKVLTFWESWNKQRGNKKEKQVQLPADAEHPSKEWQVEHTIALIEKHQKKTAKNTLCDKVLTDEKVAELEKLKGKIRSPKQGDTLITTLNDAKKMEVFNKHRLFALNDEKTSTQKFIEVISTQVAAAA